MVASNGSYFSRDQFMGYFLITTFIYFTLCTYIFFNILIRLFCESAKIMNWVGLTCELIIYFKFEDSAVPKNYILFLIS